MSLSRGFCFLLLEMKISRSSDIADGDLIFSDGEWDPVERINSHPVATSSRTGKTNKPLTRLYSNSSD